MVTKSISRSFTYHQLSHIMLSASTTRSLHYHDAPFPRTCQRTHRTSGVLDQIHMENEQLTWTLSGRHHVWKTAFQTRRFHRYPDGISTEHAGYRNNFCVLYTSGCSCQFRLLLPIISTQQTLNKVYGCKFNIKVIIAI